MLHVWFIESSNGPFAGLNFWLPFKTAGMEVPNPCWMADEEVADKIRRVSVAFAQATGALRYLLSRESTTSSDKIGADFEYREGEIETVIDATRQVGSALNDSEVERALMAGVRDAAATTLPLLEVLIFVSQLPGNPLTPEGEAHSQRFLKFHEIAMQLNAAARDDNKSAWSEAADRWIENSNEEEKESIRRTLNELTNNQMSSEERDAAGIEQPTNTGVN